jgi:hypothetical protein
MPVSVKIQLVHPRKLAAVRREVPAGGVAAAWGPALGKIWPFIRSQPGLWTNGHKTFFTTTRVKRARRYCATSVLKSPAHLKLPAKCTRPKRRRARLPSASILEVEIDGSATNNSIARKRLPLIGSKLSR